MSAMSEVVPLPSFGEVFFDARGQDRVLRVTWHDGTLVLSLWRGEMCTASFRMPMNDVGRLIDTLDEGFTEASGHEQDAGTGPFPQAGPPDQDGYPAREAYAAHAGGPQEQVQDPYAAPAQDPYATQVHDPYATQVQDAYAAAPDAYAGHGQAAEGYGAHDPYATQEGVRDPYLAQARDGYAPAEHGYPGSPDAYVQPAAADAYAQPVPARPQAGYAHAEAGYAPDGYTDDYAADNYAPDGYGPVGDGYGQAGDGYGARERRRGRDDFAEQPSRSDYEYPDYPGTGQYARPPVPPPAPAPEAQPAPAALGPNDVLVARGTPTQDRLVASSVPQTGPQTAPRPAPQAGPIPQTGAAPQPAGVDPSDPLGLGAVRPYVNEAPLYTTGERLRPDQWPAGQDPDPHADPERRGGRRSSGQWPDEGADTWEDARGW